MDKIKVLGSIKDIKKLNKGFSSDEKYIVTNNSNEKYLVRLSDIKRYEYRKKQYELLKELKHTDINIAKVIDFGVFNEEKIYTVFEYIEGVDAISVIKNYTPHDQYMFGYKAGEILKRIHKTKIEYKDSWSKIYNNKLDRKIKESIKYQNIIPKYDLVIKYIEDNRHLIKNIRRVLAHTDYHLGNMVISNDDIYIIDFDKLGFEDIYSEFKPFSWNVRESVHFENGFINSYFKNKDKRKFFNILALYAAESIISHIPWAHKFNQEQIDLSIEIANNILKYFNDFNSLIPTWYLQEVI